MTKLKSNFKLKFLAAFAGLALVFSAAALPAMAAIEEGSTDATVTFEAGTLQHTNAPSLNFGSHPIESGDQTYAATSVDDNIVVSDLTGSRKGWQLNAKLSGFKVGNNDSLQGAYITVDQPTIKYSDSNIEEFAPEVPGTITLKSAGGAAPVFTADPGKGMGIWTSVWAPENTTLTVLDGTAVAGVSNATIEWSFESTPA